MFIYSFTPKSLRNNKMSLNRTKKKERLSNKTLNEYGLWKDEKELVQSDEYDLWDFERNEMLDDFDSYKD